MGEDVRRVAQLSHEPREDLGAVGDALALAVPRATDERIRIERGEEDGVQEEKHPFVVCNHASCSVVLLGAHRWASKHK